MTAPTMDRRLRNETTIPPSALRVLVAVLELYRPGVSLSIRDICRHMGGLHANHVHVVLRRLRWEELVAFEDRLDCTIRPLVRLAMWREYLPGLCETQAAGNVGG